MANDRGVVKSSIWQDPDFLALPAGAQRLYLLLLSQPALSLCGHLPITLNRWAALAPDTTREEIELALVSLEGARFVVVDETTEELLIRTYLRHDGILDGTPNLILGMARQFGAIASSKLRGVLLESLPPTLIRRCERQGKRAPVRLAEPFRAAYLAAFEGRLDPFGNPRPKGRVDPSVDPREQGECVIHNLTPPPVDDHDKGLDDHEEWPFEGRLDPSLDPSASHLPPPTSHLPQPTQVVPPTRADTPPASESPLSPAKAADEATEGKGAKAKRNVPSQIVFDAWVEAIKTPAGHWKPGPNHGEGMVLNDARRDLINKALRQYGLDRILFTVRAWRFDPFLAGKEAGKGHTPKPWYGLEVLLRLTGTRTIWIEDLWQRYRNTAEGRHERSSVRGLLESLGVDFNRLRGGTLIEVGGGA